MKSEQEIKELKELTQKAMISFEKIIKNINTANLNNNNIKLDKKVEEQKNEDKR